MLEESAMSIAVLLVYIVFMVIVWLIAMIPAVIHGIGLARICKKMGAFKPVWCWVWALLCPPVALLRAGDMAAEKEWPLFPKKHLARGMELFIVTIVLVLIGSAFGIVTAFIADDPNVSALTFLFSIFSLILLLSSMVVSVWMSVLLYISYFRIFKLYVPTWGAWLMLAGMILFSQFSFLLLPVLSFLPMKD